MSARRRRGGKLHPKRVKHKRRWPTQTGSIRRIYCCACETKVPARLVTGEQIFPAQKALATLPYWLCDACGNAVGCHRRTEDRTRALGCIAPPEVRLARIYLHKQIDPLWRSGRIGRQALYAKLSALVGREYHTADVRTLADARLIDNWLARFAQATHKD